MMDLQIIVLAILLPVIGYFMKNIHDEVKAHRKDIQNIQVDLPSNYVQKSELKDVLERMYGELVNIRQELRSKEDRNDK